MAQIKIFSSERSPNFAALAKNIIGQSDPKSLFFRLSWMYRNRLKLIYNFSKSISQSFSIQLTSIGKFIAQERTILKFPQTKPIPFSRVVTFLIIKEPVGAAIGWLREAKIGVSLTKQVLLLKAKMLKLLWHSWQRSLLPCQSTLERIQSSETFIEQFTANFL